MPACSISGSSPLFSWPSLRRSSSRALAAASSVKMVLGVGAGAGRGAAVGFGAAVGVVVAGVEDSAFFQRASQRTSEVSRTRPLEVTVMRPSILT